MCPPLKEMEFIIKFQTDKYILHVCVIIFMTSPLWLAVDLRSF